MSKNLRENFGNKTAWALLVALLALAAVFVLTPIWLIKPFSAQTARAIELSYYLRSWSPWLTLFAAAAGFALALLIWARARRRLSRVALVVPLVLLVALAWLARQNHFEWMFSPLAASRFASIAEADFIADDEMVLAVEVGGEAVAFPVRLIAYHHIAEAVVGGTPITATY